MSKLTEQQVDDIAGSMLDERAKYQHGTAGYVTMQRALAACGYNTNPDRSLSFEEAHNFAQRNPTFWLPIIELMTQVNWGRDPYLEENTTYTFQERLANARKLKLLTEDDYAANQRDLHSREEAWCNSVGLWVQMAPDGEWLGICPRDRQSEVTDYWDKGWALDLRVLDALANPERYEAEQRLKKLPKFRL